MKRIYIKWLKGGLLGLLTIFGIISCSDDHFDLNTTNASGTLWENLIATQKCDSFAMILQKTLVNKKDYGTPVTLTYEELLKSNRTLTLWAPQDGACNAKYWLDLLAAGDNETVETQFVANHIAYFNYNGSYPVTKRIMLANEKYAIYDDSTVTNTFNGVPILSDSKYKNIASSNGSLHLIESASPFLPNLRELLSKYSDLSDLYTYIKSRDTLIFLPESSIPGTTVNGQIQYVDSVFYKYNKVLPRIAEQEDSLSAAIIPSNTAWQEALTKVSKSYVYKTRYPYYDSKKALNYDTIKADSISTLYTMNAIFDNMFYSLNEQPGFNVNTASTSTVSNFFNTADSLLSTVYYNYNYLYHQHAPECRTLAEGKTPYTASNGYGFITDHFNFKANKSWQFDIVFDGEDSWLINTNQTSSVSSSDPQGVRHKITDGNRNDSVIGTVRGQAYQQFVPGSSAAKPVITYNLPNVCSGTYDIYVVIVPENMIDVSNKSPKYNRFTATLAYDFQTNGIAVTKTLPTTFQSNPTKVDTILLFENFKFPYAFYGLPNAKPYITLKSAYSTRNRQYETNYMNIDCFILKSKDE